MKTLDLCVLVRCIPRRRVCLSDSSDCPQYECVSRPAVCDRNSMEPACDIDGRVHRSLCHLQQSGKMLAYMGHCQVGDTDWRRLHRNPTGSSWIIYFNRACNNTKSWSSVEMLLFFSFTFTLMTIRDMLTSILMKVLYISEIKKRNLTWHHSYLMPSNWPSSF